jgi:hypothetical protein
MTPRSITNRTEKLGESRLRCSCRLGESRLRCSCRLGESRSRQSWRSQRTRQSRRHHCHGNSRRACRPGSRRRRIRLGPGGLSERCRDFSTASGSSKMRPITVGKGADRPGLRPRPPRRRVAGTGRPAASLSYSGSQPEAEPASDYRFRILWHLMDLSRDAFRLT